MNVELLLGLTEKYLRKVIKTVSPLAKEEKGRRILGVVRGRPRTEDVKIEVDKICEELFQDLLQKYQLPIQVFSEHDTYGDSSPECYCGSDPFDGSWLFKSSIRFEWYSGLSFFDLKSNPLAGGTADILNKEIYLADCQAKRCFLLKGRHRTPVLLKPRKKVLDRGTWVASYMMVPEYFLPLAKIMPKIWKKFPDFRHWPNGGAGIYQMIARGIIQVYVMPDEPRIEIDSGLAFAEAANFPVVSVKDDGTYEPYKFLPGKQAERVPFFIAAASEELVKAILEAINA